jgi:hypothetical protein
MRWDKEVTGSKGDKYHVVYDFSRGWTCTCPGYQYHGGKPCKHIKAAEKEKCSWNWEAFCGDTGDPKEGPTGKLCPMCNAEVELVKVGV